MTDRDFMLIALAEAQKGENTVGENPMVGAVIVEDGKIVSQAFHVRPGELHAERIALNNLGRKPQSGATMYVTLEPCSTHGRTGKCTDYLIASGISRVVLGAIDPNPAHRGAGINILRSAGITVDTGVLEKECTDLNSAFNEAMKKLSAKK